MKLRKIETTPLRAKGLGATEDRVGDRTGPGAGYDISNRQKTAVPKTPGLKTRASANAPTRGSASAPARRRRR